ncbi:hypothetical protein HX810_02815 [Pseudomonas salomonii]|uniref:Uncharacterized protein n=1 Tax=Pseudomonas salomonii TaxID=191391 RepID=A0A7Y8KLV6_9PSED|nr:MULTISPECIES: hypothetical protein [Pseudomonas]NWF06610.1 hypothetical protein [Pseudomonas salomonii]CRM61200.1 hypothetical protein [Pseudomonas sp. 58 R 3]
MWTPKHYRTLVRASAWYDLIITAAFVTPWSFALVHGLLQGLNLPGELPPFLPAHVLMANLLGSIVCVWAVLRIRDPQRQFGLYDAAGRGLFATWQLYALMQGATSVLWIILLLEVLWGVAQLLPVNTDQKMIGARKPL